MATRFEIGKSYTYTNQNAFPPQMTGATVTLIEVLDSIIAYTFVRIDGVKGTGTLTVDQAKAFLIPQ